ncbi:hypothetical protein IJ541_04910 [bacterium]|nr:hypothetical protein [bacterium]
MKKIITTFLLASLIIPATVIKSEASLISDRAYRAEQRRESKENIKQIKALFKVHDTYANNHEIENLQALYADNYMNNDGFDKKAYVQSIKDTWKACKDITYTTKILSINVNGDNASINVEETASGTVFENLDMGPIAGEIHSKSLGIYHLVKINGSWYISGETSLTDESSLLYGDARFMNIELQTPAQVASGETYTASLKVDADKDTFIVGSIEHDPVTYPANTPKNNLRALNNQSQTLERFIKANTDNINEYAVASIAISKISGGNSEHVKIYMAGLACVMRRVNVIPKNNFINIKD